MFALAGITQISPQGFDRLKQGTFWFTVGAALLPPLVLTLSGMSSSENPSLWMSMGLMIAFASAGVGYLIGLFLPEKWPLWGHAAPGFVFWTIVYLVAWYR